jgi:hypothetical protein
MGTTRTTLGRIAAPVHARHAIVAVPQPRGDGQPPKQPLRQHRQDRAKPPRRGIGQAQRRLKEDRMGIVALVALALLGGVLIANSGTQTPRPMTEEQRPLR